MRWKAEVRRAAEGVLPPGFQPTDDAVAFQAVYYHQKDAGPDIDNIIKPMQDALIGVVYIDDSQITDTRASRRNLDTDFNLTGITPVLARGLASGDAFVHILITDPPDHTELLI